jgi:hypothetical protein
MALGCARMPPVQPPVALGFDFGRDTFAFANETVWEYQVDPVTGATRWTKRDPVPPFSLRCGNMARAARQFRLHARFVPDAPRLDTAGYAALVRTVLARDARSRAPSPDPVVVPGYANLRALSADHPGVLQEALGGSWQSYVQRGNWRMIFPFSEHHQRATAARLAEAAEAGALPIVHVLRYPELTVNHMLLLYAAERSAAGTRFLAYDPNDAAQPLVLAWDAGAGQFDYPRTIYFGGGPVKVYEVYDGLLY